MELITGATIVQLPISVTVSTVGTMSFYCYVAVPPVMMSTFDDETAIEGDAVSISCTASGLPDPTYSFTKVSSFFLCCLLHVMIVVLCQLCDY